jgi:serine/threonine protein kinase
MSDRAGQQIGNYRLVELLGKGTFAEVYLAEHRYLPRQAAIKILYLFDVDARKFQEEAEITAKLEHPHIVRLLDFSIEQDTPFLVLDYAPGGSLRTRHPRGSVLSLARVGEYLKEIAPALQYAHEHHFLHRDIKPENLLIGRKEELLLSDFGIAVLTQTGRTSLVAAYNIAGTPYYMAPEAYRGRPVKESDVYALAVVVYEWLCGSVPFSQGDFIQLGFLHASEPVPSLREKNPAIPKDVETVLFKALSKDPKDRFRSVQAFATAFEQACLSPAYSYPVLPPGESQLPAPPALPQASAVEQPVSGHSTPPKLSLTQSPGQTVEIAESSRQSDAGEIPTRSPQPSEKQSQPLAPTHRERPEPPRPPTPLLSGLIGPVDPVWVAVGVFLVIVLIVLLVLASLYPHVIITTPNR